MADLGALRELAAFMREVGAVHARDGELELHLGPAPVRDGSAPSSPSADVDEPDSLEALCYGTGLDTSIFRRAGAD